MAALQPGSEPCPGPAPAGTPILDLPASRTVRNNRLLRKPRVAGPLLQQPEPTETPPARRVWPREHPRGQSPLCLEA